MTRLTTLATLHAKGATVTVEQEATASGDPLRFLITTTTGYRAVLPACSCDRTPHLGRSYPKGGSSRTLCLGSSSGRHAEHALALAADIAKTYGGAARGVSRGPLTVARRPSMTPDEWAAARGERDWHDLP